MTQALRKFSRSNPSPTQRQCSRHSSGMVLGNEFFWAGKQKGLEAGVTHKDTQGVFIEQHRTASAAKPIAIFHSFSGIGGKRGWFYANILWKLRGWLDQLVGGVGMGRGRRDPDTLQPGDVLDGWRVETVDEGRLIRLWFEMKAPGPAWLQFEAQPRADGRQPAQRNRLFRAAWYPRSRVLVHALPIPFNDLQRHVAGDHSPRRVKQPVIGGHPHGLLSQTLLDHTCSVPEH